MISFAAAAFALLVVLNAIDVITSKSKTLPTLLSSANDAKTSLVQPLLATWFYNIK